MDGRQGQAQGHSGGSNHNDVLVTRSQLDLWPLVSLIYTSQAAYRVIQSSEAKGTFLLGQPFLTGSAALIKDAKISVPLFGERTADEEQSTLLLSNYKNKLRARKVDCLHSHDRSTHEAPMLSQTTASWSNVSQKSQNNLSSNHYSI